MSVRIRWRNLELPLRVAVDTETLTETYGRFTAEPFQRGYGTTIGNALRRVLLTSLEGASVCSFRVKGLKSGATSIPHLAEDLDHLAMNVKRLRVRMDNGADEVVLKSEVEGKEELSAGDFEDSESAEILNPDLVLGRIPDKGKLGLELRVRKGRGYLVADELDLDAAANEVPIDAFFSPVRRVEFSIESTRVGKMTNYDRLILQIWTNGSVSPEDAMVTAGRLLQKHLNPLVLHADPGVEVPIEDKIETLPDGGDGDASGNKVLDIPVSTLDLSVRAHNCIVSANISTVGELVARSEGELLKIRNFGKTSLKEIKKKLGDMGLAFRADDDEDISLDDDDDDEPNLEDLLNIGDGDLEEPDEEPDEDEEEEM